jgi:lactoylglutathione lyase
MKMRMDHMNINTIDLEKSLAFYRDAFDLKEVSRIAPDHGEFILAYLTDGVSGFRLEITWLAERKEPYNLDDNEIHLCFRTDDYEAALKKHKEMGIVAMENDEMGIYFVEDPDGYWVEVVPERN